MRGNQSMNKMKKILSVLCILSCVTICALAASIIASLTSCNKTHVAPQPEAPVEKKEKPIIISLCFSTNMQAPRAVASTLFKEEVEKNSGGRIKIEIYPDGQKGGDGELIEGMIKGSVDMTISSAGNFAVYATKIGISALPFLFTDFEEAWRFMDSDLEAEVAKTLEEFGILVLSNFDNGFRCVTTTSRPIKTAADMKGLNIRTPPNQIVMETMSSLGASPKPYAFNELKKALREGLFDSQENPIPVIYNSGLYEEQKYLSVTNHSYDAMPFVIRKALWEGLGDEDKAIILEAAKKAGNLDRKLVKEQTESYVEKLREKGMTITNPDIKTFQSATSSVMEVFTDVYGETLLDKLRSYLQ